MPEKTAPKSSSHEDRNIIDLLKQDHERARYLFDKLQKSGRREIATLEKLFT